MASSVFLFFFLFLFLSLSSAQNDAVSPSPSPSHFSPFRPSIAVIVGVLTTLFSIIFLLLLYAKHCNNNGSNNNHHNNGITTTSFSHSSSSAAVRKNSGIDRAVIESLPVFRFGSLLHPRSRHHHHHHLDCAVCLSRFDDSEVLRLLPKCRHAFHVECVDTWLDAHSTCPLCRFRVDPEDVLLMTPFYNPPTKTVNQLDDAVAEDVEMGRRISGRHSSAGERRRVLFQMLDTVSFRRSLDSWSWRKKRSDNTTNTSEDNQQSSVAVGRFEPRERKDGLLLTHDQRSRSARKRLEHRIIVSPPGCGEGGGDGGGGVQFCYKDERWSDVQPSDLLYLRSEMIMTDSRRRPSSGSTGAKTGRHQNDKDGKRQEEEDERTRLCNLYSSSSTNMNAIDTDHDDGDGNQSGRRVISTRSVSEITGLSRLSSNDNESGATNDTNRLRRQRQRGLLRRWVAWASQLRPQQTPPPLPPHFIIER